MAQEAGMVREEGSEQAGCVFSACGALARELVEAEAEALRRAHELLHVRRVGSALRAIVAQC